MTCLIVSVWENLMQLQFLFYFLFQRFSYPINLFQANVTPPPPIPDNIRKLEVFLCFQGVLKGSIALKQVKPLGACCSKDFQIFRTAKKLLEFLFLSCSKIVTPRWTIIIFETLMKSKSMDWFLYNRDLRYERAKGPLEQRIY